MENEFLTFAREYTRWLSEIFDVKNVFWKEKFLSTLDW